MLEHATHAPVPVCSTFDVVFNSYKEQLLKELRCQILVHLAHLRYAATMYEPLA